MVECESTDSGSFTCNHGVRAVTLAVPDLVQDPVLGEDELQLCSRPRCRVAPIKLFAT